jgi:hypothetical protein
MFIAECGRCVVDCGFGCICLYGTAFSSFNGVDCCGKDLIDNGAADVSRLSFALCVLCMSLLLRKLI